MNIASIPNIARVPYFGYAQIFEADDSVSSSYNGLQLKLDKRASHGLSFWHRRYLCEISRCRFRFLWFRGQFNHHLPAEQLRYRC